MDLDPVRASSEEGSRNDDGIVSTEPDVVTVNSTSEKIEDHVRFQRFFKALRKRDWKGVEDFISEDPQALTYKFHISQDQENVLHVLARDLNVPVWLLKKLVLKVDPEELERLSNQDGQNPLFMAAWSGNTKAARVFVGRNKDLPNKRSNNNSLAIHVAAQGGHKAIIQYLLSVTGQDLDDEKGVPMLRNLINSAQYGIAFDLLKRYPNLARERYQDRKNILEMLANKPLAFESGSRLGFWMHLIYKWIPVQEEGVLSLERVDRNVKNPAERSKKLNKFIHLGYICQQIFYEFGALCQKLNITFWNALMLLVPGLQWLHDTKLTHMKTLEIVRAMCHDRVIWSKEEVVDAFWTAWSTAARLGIYEIINEILNAYFYSYTFCPEKSKRSVFHIAILHRQEKVISLLNQQNIFKCHWRTAVNSGEKSDNILHLTGKFVASSQVSGAAMQMQRELQWFKAVESYVHPSLQEHRNKSNKTPREVFTEEHKDLVKEGEKWMKETAQSCSVVGALIITVVFAAAFTVPGGNNTEGIPTFLHKPHFIVFVIADALALFSSTASVLMFLGILTSRYSEDDFLEALPKKLIIGLITLFFSIASMTVAFGATVYIVLSNPWKWVIIPIALLGCLPVTLFAWLQFPLLVEIYSSTYRSSVFQAFAGNKGKIIEMKDEQSIGGNRNNV